jgi:hypothetical protein
MIRKIQWEPDVNQAPFFDLFLHIKRLNPKINLIIFPAFNIIEDGPDLKYEGEKVYADPEQALHMRKEHGARRII